MIVLPRALIEEPMSPGTVHRLRFVSHDECTVYSALAQGLGARGEQGPLHFVAGDSDWDVETCRSDEDVVRAVVRPRSPNGVSSFACSAMPRRSRRT